MQNHRKPIFQTHKTECKNNIITMSGFSGNGVWDEPDSFHHPEGTPAGFTLR